jgi:hypothetical protein
MTDYTNGVISCVSCPAHSTCMNIVNPISYPSCNAPWTCGCNAGYYGDAAWPESELPCTPCPAGTTCAVGDCTYADHCVPGPPCDAGYTGPDGGPCTACVAGLYKSATGSDPCEDCAPGTYSDTAAVTCTACPAGTYKPEYGPGTCMDCTPGKYSIVEGAFSCIRCRGGTYKNTTGSGICTNCPSTSYSNNGVGATGCLPCFGNSICYDILNAAYGCNTPSACQCPAGTYGDAHIGIACTFCPPNTGSACVMNGCVTLNDCECNAGYTGPGGGPCTVCAAGKYKASTGSEACTDCRARSTSTEASTSSAACLCNAGLYLFSSGVSGCVGCTHNTYKDVIGNQVCTACPANTYPEALENPDGYTPRLSSSCIACPSGSSCPNYYCGHIRDCRCDAGHYGQRESVCLPCDAGSYAPDIGYSFCPSCQPGYYQDQTGATACKQCRPGTSSDYTATGGPVTCTGCPEVFDPVTNACVSCANNTVWGGAVSKCVCAMGFQPA